MTLRRCMLAVAALVLAACTIPTNDEPQVIASDNVPAVLLEGTTTTTTTTTPDSPLRPEPVYFVETVDGVERLRAVDREYPVEVGIQFILDDLMTNGPDPDDGSGLESNLEQITLVDAQLGDDGILVVNVVGLFGETGLQSTGQVVAAAQIVFTAVADEDVDAVRFLDDGEPVAAPASGSDLDVDDAVDASNYAALAPA